MSLLNYSRYPCVHCQGNAFRAEFEDMGGELGHVKFLRCLNCDVAYAEYTPEQKALLAKWEAEAEAERDEAEAEAERDEAQARIAAEELEEQHPEITRPYAVRVNGGRIGMFATQDEASAFLKEWADRWAKPGDKLEVWREPYWGKRELLEEVMA